MCVVVQTLSFYLLTQNSSYFFSTRSSSLSLVALQSSLLPMTTTTHLLYSNGVSTTLSAANRRRVVFFSDVVGLRFKTNKTRRKIGLAAGGRIPGSTSVTAALHFQEKINKKKPDPKMPYRSNDYQVANLEEILSERGACAVGFIANLDNKATHEIVKDALTALGCMEHRGGCGADNDSGDGAGLMTSIPWDLFDNWANKQGIDCLDKSCTGVGMVFPPKDEVSMKEAKEVIVNTFRQEGLEVLGWRPVPVNMSVVGYYAKEALPNIQQIFVKVLKEESIDDIERELYICRKLIEKSVKSEHWGDELYFCSLSSQTVVYKGMLRSEVLGQFYSDLQSDLYKSPFAIYHRRYSTNTKNE